MAGEWAIVAAGGIGVIGGTIPVVADYFKDKRRAKAEADSSAQRETARERLQNERYDEVLRVLGRLTYGSSVQENEMRDLKSALLLAAVATDDPAVAAICQKWAAMDRQEQANSALADEFLRTVKGLSYVAFTTIT